MKIGLLINKIDTNGGIQKNYRLLYELFKSKGHDTYLFVMYKPQLIKVEENNIIFLDGESLNQKGLSLEKHINDIGKFNLFIVNAAQLKKFLKDQNYYLTTHNTWSKKLNSRNFFKKWKKLRRLRKELKNENLIGISNGVIDDLNNILKIPTKTSKTIYAPHNFEKVKEQANEEIDIKSDYILGLGGLQKRKRFHLLIEVFSKIVNKYPNLKLVIVGDGSEYNNLLNLIKKLDLEKKVMLLGFRENPYPYVKNAKLLVSCSFEEGLPRVLVESLILNTPIVSSKSSTSICEVMSTELEKYICEVDNEEDLKDKICKALESYPTISTDYYDKFNQENIYNEYIKLAKN